MPFNVICGQLTKMNVDAVVNPTNIYFELDGEICDEIYHSAGIEKLHEACQNIAPITKGRVAITPAFALPAKYIIHTVAPSYYDGNKGEADKLRKCYFNSLKIAVENNCKSIAFPLISTGVYRFPKYESLVIAIDVFTEFIKKNDIAITLVLPESHGSLIPKEESLKYRKAVVTFIDILGFKSLIESRSENVIADILNDFKSSSAYTHQLYIDWHIFPTKKRRTKKTKKK